MRIAKRITSVVLGLMFCGMVANATVSISWVWNEGTDGGVNAHDNSGFLQLGNVVQLIWTSDQAVSAVSASDPLTPTGGDILLGQNTMTSDGWWNFGIASYDATLPPWSLPDDTFVGGYVYQRVFDDLALDGLDSGIDYYADSISEQIVGPLNDQDPTPGTSNFSYLYSSGTFDGSNFSVIPEPTSMGLFLLGGLAMVIRRKCRK